MRQLLLRFNSDRKYAVLLWRAGWLAYLAVLVLGSIPGAREEVGVVASGLVLHFVTYACIGFCLFCGTAGDAIRKGWSAFLIVAAMGACDEFVQSFFPYRTASPIDWLVDASAGLFVALLLRNWLTAAFTGSAR